MNRRPPIGAGVREHIRLLWAAVESLRPVPAPGQRVRHTTRGVTVTAATAPPAPIALPAIVKEDAGAHLVCELLRVEVAHIGSTPVALDRYASTGTEVLVLKPAPLRGVTASPDYAAFTNTQAGGTYDYTDNCIFVARLAAPFPLRGAGDTVWCAYVDLNADARVPAPPQPIIPT